MVIFNGAKRIHLYCAETDCNFSVKEWLDDFDTNQLKMCPNCMGNGKVIYLKWEFVRSRPEYVRY